MSLKKQAVNSIKWTTISASINSIIQIIQLFILARLLGPEDFGLMAIVMVVIGFSQIFIDMGISNAIIYKQEIKNDQLSSLFWLNIFIGILFLGLLMLLSPIISRFYENYKLILLINIVAITFLVKPLGQQFMVLLQKNLFFNSIAKTEIISRLISFSVVIGLAYKDYGVFSLAIGAVVFSVFSSIGYVFYGLKIHKPTLYLKISDIKEFVSFGLYQLGEKVLNYFSSQFDVILIGKLLGVEVLGIYNIAKDLVIKPSMVINPIITRVTFPVMSKINTDINKLKSIFLKIINYLTYINSVIYFLIASLAKPIVLILFGQDWIGAVPIIQILSITYLLRSISNPAGSLLLSRGKANIAFYWKLAIFFLYPFFVIIGSLGGVVGVALGMLILQILLFYPNWRFIVFKMIEVEFGDYFTKIITPIAISMISVLISSFIFYSLENIYIKIIAVPLIFSVLFVSIVYKYQRIFILELLNLLKSKFN
jgi:O-antigen/teichoic acid export membrane protein